MTRKEAAFIRQARVGHLATVDEQGQPLNLPFCFAFDGEFLYSPIDEKPKTAAPRELKRVRNIRANPRVSVVVHRYDDEDWSRLAHIIIQGRPAFSRTGRRIGKPSGSCAENIPNTEPWPWTNGP